MKRYDTHLLRESHSSHFAKEKSQQNLVIFFTQIIKEMFATF